MKISSVRLGFANNSSSDHSLLLGCKNPASEELCDFGWQNFLLKSEQSKLIYLALQLFFSLPENISSDYKWMIVKGILNIDIPKHTMDHGIIDHQSIISFPYNFEGTELHKDFLNDFRSLLLREDVSVAGGNDNSDFFTWDCDDIILEKSRSNESVLTNMLLRDESIADKLVAKKDGNWYILFNRNNGTKIRINFQDQDCDYFFSRTPELVDIKITNRCKRYCGFCYQNSTADGTHADYDKISQLIYNLADMQVFEVAIGGGEPTLHPDFCNILETCRNYHVIPNFTTYSVENVTKNPAIREAVLKYAGSFASSEIFPGNIADIKSWNNNEEVQCSLQIPLGTHDPLTIQRALDLARSLGVNFTLLGFKNSGKGQTYRKYDYGWIMDYLKQNNVNKFGADTLFVKKFRRQLKEIGVPQELMVGEEGRYSCYIDMVGSKFGESSYTNKSVGFTDVNHLVRLMSESFPFVRRKS